MCQSPAHSVSTHVSPTLILLTLYLTGIWSKHCPGPNHFKAHKQYNQSREGGRERPAMTHLHTQVFILLLGEQTEDDTVGRPRPDSKLDSRLSRGKGPQELELNVAPAVKGELWSRLSIKKHRLVQLIQLSYEKHMKIQQKGRTVLSRRIM